ncbi:copper resistance protein CopC [Streptomyces sp. FXJ1.172]|uniref:copper resistance CopC/CopD family protein n=1 Tax=Streptomyces sp. FXJ1.172 TaxID=710705 RepID=UPI0009A00255|nr:copper resistance protein CopC [Streptomyces sp. FXJ1.172]WEO96559.1 copper resistance protein CopC [Streptomyces sp. FXJ1.172]
MVSNGPELSVPIGNTTAHEGDEVQRDRHRWPRRLTLLCAGLFLLLLGTAAPASAHAALRATDPADGIVLGAAPRQVTLTFSESVGLLTDSFRVYDPANRRVRTGSAGHAPGSPDTARVALPGKLAAGTYMVAWRVVSADSHPVSGALTFSVGRRTATTASAAPDSTENPATAALYNVARYLAYLSVALLLGTAAFVAYCRPPKAAPLRAPVLTAAWTLMAATAALLVLRAPYEEGTAPAQALSLGSLARTATTRTGELLLARLALLLLAAAVVAVLRARRRRLPRRATLTVAAAVSLPLALTWSAAEHASAGIQVPLAITAATLHLLAMGVWLGGLAALLRTLSRIPALLLSVPARFSRLASASVTVLVVTGVYQSWRGLGSWQALTDTAYGRTLLAKLAAVTALLLAAACSRAWTSRMAQARSRTATTTPVRVPEPATGPPLPEEPPAPAPPPPPVPFHVLRRSVLAEAAAAVVVLALTTLLTTTVPGRAATGAAQSGTADAGIPTASVTTIPFDLGTPGGHGKVQVTLDPGRVGRTSVQAVVYGPDGGLSTVPELRVSLTLPAQRIGPLDTKVTDRGGYWAADSFDLPIPGTWTMKATVRVSDLDQVTVSAPVRVVR